ncbi:MOSC domain-containing protein [Dickeya dadantii]|uniref:MOSC domain-containing protein n=1 Tax=Dickeya dadantii TaxID=204038 RepID=UPI0014957BB8|nr:MOSC domain-containing protein [Dickeya dadantii]NPE59184.1 MOSC domain-containing protein [Dickeya dadantii]NPE69434.1 MOSC domain-containing protein [Dickeya dadantii]
MIKIEQLISYPLKSGAGIKAEVIKGGISGIDGDREFCLYRKSDNKFISMRDNILISDVLIVPDGNMLAVRCHQNEKYFDITGAEKNNIRIWSRDVDVSVMPSDASEYISSLIGEDVILAKLYHPGDYSQSFMDTGPLHIISTAELTSLASAIGCESINPLVFRPNIIVSDFAGISEDSVEKVTINGVRFTVTERTERCNAVSLLHKKIHGIDDSELLENIDEANDYEGALFGLYLQAENRFQLNVGDEVIVS